MGAVRVIGHRAGPPPTKSSANAPPPTLAHELLGKGGVTGKSVPFAGSDAVVIQVKTHAREAGVIMANVHLENQEPLYLALPCTFGGRWESRAELVIRAVSSRATPAVAVISHPRAQLCLAYVMSGHLHEARKLTDWYRVENALEEGAIFPAVSLALPLLPEDEPPPEIAESLRRAAAWSADAAVLSALLASQANDHERALQHLADLLWLPLPVLTECWSRALDLLSGYREAAEAAREDYQWTGEWVDEALGDRVNAARRLLRAWLPFADLTAPTMTIRGVDMSDVEEMSRLDRDLVPGLDRDLVPG